MGALSIGGRGGVVERTLRVGGFLLLLLRRERPFSVCVGRTRHRIRVEGRGLVDLQPEMPLVASSCRLVSGRPPRHRYLRHGRQFVAVLVQPCAIPFHGPVRVLVGACVKLAPSCRDPFVAQSLVSRGASDGTNQRPAH